MSLQKKLEDFLKHPNQESKNRLMTTYTDILRTEPPSKNRHNQSCEENNEDDKETLAKHIKDFGRLVVTHELSTYTKILDKEADSINETTLDLTLENHDEIEKSRIACAKLRFIRFLNIYLNNLIKYSNLRTAKGRTEAYFEKLLQRTSCPEKIYAARKLKSEFDKIATHYYREKIQEIENMSDNETATFQAQTDQSLSTAEKAFSKHRRSPEYRRAIKITLIIASIITVGIVPLASYLLCGRCFSLTITTRSSRLCNEIRESIKQLFKPPKSTRVSAGKEFFFKPRSRTKPAAALKSSASLNLDITRAYTEAAMR